MYIIPIYKYFKRDNYMPINPLYSDYIVEHGSANLTWMLYHKGNNSNN